MNCAYLNSNKCHPSLLPELKRGFNKTTISCFVVAPFLEPVKMFLTNVTIQVKATEYTNFSRYYRINDIHVRIILLCCTLG